MRFTVAFLGFSDFERSALASYFRLALGRTPHYEQVPDLSDADFLVADAEHEPSVQLVLATEREARTVFIGGRAPPGCPAWMPRPIDAMNVMRELDLMAAREPGWDPPSVPAPPAAPVRAPVLPRVLLIDDSDIALRYLGSRLARWQVEVDTATGSSRALVLLAAHHYELVFLDLELGDESPLDGLGLCQHIKRSVSSMDSTVVMVSAHHSELDRVRGTMAGCDAYLAKPLPEVELQRLLLRQGFKPVREEGATAA
jgi:CheY-like chemotaxis protein